MRAATLSVICVMKVDKRFLIKLLVKNPYDSHRDDLRHGSLFNFLQWLLLILRGDKEVYRAVVKNVRPKIHQTRTGSSCSATASQRI